MVKQLFLFIAISHTTIVFSQSSEKFYEIKNSWTQGKLEENGSVVQADFNLGGWYRLIVNSNDSVEFKSPFSCGFGFIKYGKWYLNQEDSIITLNFTRKEGYMNNPEKENINETEVFQITKLSSNELVLSEKSTQKKLIFISNNK